MSHGSHAGPPPGATPLRVLVLEDSAADAEIVVRELTRAGYVCDVRRVDTEAAYRAALAERTELILADYALPGFGAPAALRVLREEELDVPLIVVTGSVGEEAVAECLRLGAADCVLTDRLARLGAAAQQAIAAARLREERRGANRALVESERRARLAAHDYWTVFEHSSDAIVIFEPVSELIVAANARACEIYGYARDELVGMSFKTLTEDVAHGEATIARLLREGRVQGHQAVHRRRDGRAFHIVSSATLVDYQGRPAALSVVLDVEASFRAEEERQRLVRDLGERVKELTLLQRAARLLQSADLALPDLLERLVSLLPPGWQYPDVAAARVAIGSYERRTANWADTPWTQRLEFATREGRGVVEVAYLEARPPAGEGPFLPEERQVLESLADMLRTSIDQRATQAALRRSEEHYRSLIEHAADAIFVLSTDGAVAYASPSALRALHRPDGVIGTAITEYLHPDDRALAQDVVGQARTTGAPQRAELRVRGEGGCWRSFEAVGTPLREDDEVVGVVVNARDVTERRAAEDATRAEQAFRRAVEDSLIAGLSVVDADGRLTYVNRALCEMLGWTEAELVGSSPPYPYWPPEERERIHEVLRATIAGTFEGQSVETRYQRRNGERLDVLVLPSTLRDSSGTVHGWLAAVYDITERKRLEEQFQQAQKMEAVGRLAGGVAHDFNNLLTAILGYAALAAESLGSDHPVAADLAEIRAAGESATRLARQLLAFSRRQVVELQPIDLNGVTASVERMLQRLIGEDVELVVEQDADLPPVRADPGQMEQVLMNLAVNARDAMPRGGRLTIGTAAVHVDDGLAHRVLGLRPGLHARLSVRDTGTGMDETVQAHLFEPFFTTKPQGKGTGLGLATVYGIVQQSRGQIDVRSVPGHGTTFDVYLPATDLRRRAAAAPAGVPAAARTGSVLLVEDDPAVRGLVRRMLADAGFEVVDGTAEEALVVARQPGVRIDLLLTDVVMPGMSGGELAQRFAGIHPATPVLFMTGYTEDQLVRAGVAAGAVPLLQKPFTADTLLARVAEVLAHGGRTRPGPPGR